MIYEYYKTGSGWRWRAKGDNGEIIAAGEEYKTKRNCLHGIELMQNSGNAEVVQVKQKKKVKAAAKP